MNKHTFGKDRCAEVLISILNKNPKSVQKHVNQLLQKYINELEQLKEVSNIRMRVQWLQRIRIHYRQKLDIFEKEIKEFIDCVMTVKYRIKLREWQVKNKV